jgi:hypothetical protein
MHKKGNTGMKCPNFEDLEDADDELFMKQIRRPSVEIHITEKPGHSGLRVSAANKYKMKFTLQ